MRNFSAAECGKTIRRTLRSVPHLIFRKLLLDNFPHSAIRIPQSTRAPAPAQVPVGVNVLSRISVGLRQSRLDGRHVSWCQLNEITAHCATLARENFFRLLNFLHPTVRPMYIPHPNSLKFDRLWTFQLASGMLADWAVTADVVAVKYVTDNTHDTYLLTDSRVLLLKCYFQKHWL